MVTLTVACVVYILSHMSAVPAAVQECPAAGTIPCVCATVEDSCAGHYYRCTNDRVVCIEGWTDPSTLCVTPAEPQTGGCIGAQQCINQGVCFEGACCCQQGYTGAHCNEGVDECAADPCGPEVTCNDLHNAYVCECPDGSFSNNQPCDGVLPPNEETTSATFDTTAKGAVKPADRGGKDASTKSSDDMDDILLLVLIFGSVVVASVLVIVITLCCCRNTETKSIEDRQSAHSADKGFSFHEMNGGNQAKDAKEQAAEQGGGNELYVNQEHSRIVAAAYAQPTAPPDEHLQAPTTVPIDYVNTEGGGAATDTNAPPHHPPGGALYENDMKSYFVK